MKSKFKLWLFGAMSLVGLVLCVVFWRSWGSISQIVQEVLSMIGVSLLTIGTIYFFLERKRVKYPEKYERYVIEQSDERNVSIRYKAGCRAGRVTVSISAFFMMLVQFKFIDDFLIRIFPGLVVVLYWTLDIIFNIKYNNE